MNAKNHRPASLKLDGKKIALFVIVLAVGGYQWYTSQNSAENPVAEQTANPKTPFDQDYQLNFPAEKTSAQPNPKNELAGSYLKPNGGKNLKSPAGLVYTGGRSEHRSDHVLRHADDIPDREDIHGVFYANGDDVFRLLDEAYALVKSNSRQVKTTPAGNGKTEYVIDMKRKIGYKGGKPGNRQNNPELYKVKLILGDNRVITAFPY